MYICDDIKQQIAIVKSSEYFERYLREIKERYEAKKGHDAPELSFLSFNKFWKTGDRSEYENKYFERRERLNWALILYLLYEKQEYLDEISNMIWLICGEVTWALPAHFHFDNCTPENYWNYIDLFAAETALYLAETDYLIGDKLPDKVSRLLKSNIIKRTIDSYRDNNFWWETLEGNWSAVCAGSIGMVYMYLAPERFNSVKDRILNSIECFLKGYGDDGCCKEGISYWRYGFGYFIMFSDMLYRFTNGSINLMNNKKVENIAKYIGKIFLKNNTVVSFSDGNMQCERLDIWIISYLAKYFDGFSVPKDVLTPTCSSFPLKPSFHIRNILWTEPKKIDGIDQADCGTVYFEDAQWYIAKQEKYSFAAKAGHNGDSHNHNDIGTFIIADESGQLIADIGAMEYTRDNFNEKRYTFLQNSSFGHSVPIIDESPQKDGQEYFGKVLKVTDNEFSLEIQDAYEIKVDRLIRHFKLNDASIELIDEISDNSGHKITERFIAVIEPEEIKDGIKIGNFQIRAKGYKKITKKVLTKYTKNDFEVYLIDFDVTGNVFTAKFIFGDMGE